MSDKIREILQEKGIKHFFKYFNNKFVEGKKEFGVNCDNVIDDMVRGTNHIDFSRDQYRIIHNKNKDTMEFVGKEPSKTYNACLYTRARSDDDCAVYNILMLNVREFKVH